MPTVWNSDRWKDGGYNDAGDRVYERVGSQSRPTTAATSSSQMTVAALREVAEARGLPTTGSKKDLIDRLAGVENA